jgi:hypothetical protein
VGNKTAFEKMNAHMTDLVRKGVPKGQAIADLKAYLKQIGRDKTVSTATATRAR